MEETPRFRTAVGGFHKTDVSEYIAKTAAAHRAQLQEKDQEIQKLKKELERLEEAARQPANAPGTATAHAPEETAAETPAGTPEENLEAEPINRLELEAYRRAEAAERLASQRAKKLYEALGQVCQDAQTQLNSADSAARKTIDAMEAQIKTLEETYAALTEALSGARQQLLSMDAMIPDPAEALEEK